MTAWGTAEARGQLEVRIRQVLKEHQRDGLNMIGNVEKLTGRLVTAVQEWLEDETAAEKKSA